MSAFFNIVAEPDCDLIRISGSGFFTLADVAAFGGALERAHAQLRCAPHCQLTFADVSAMHIQSQEVVMAFTAIARDPRLRSRRFAVVVGNSLARGQTKRLSEPGDQRVAHFHDRIAAEAWLFADPVTAARTASRYRHAPASPTSAGRDCTARSVA